MTLTEIGRIKTTDRATRKHSQLRDQEGIIVVHGEFADGLYGLSEHKYIHVLFRSGSNDGYGVQVLTDCLQRKGVFATRNPYRPSNIGLNTVALIGVEGNVLRVRGVIAEDNSPVYDLKPFLPDLDAQEVESQRFAQLKADPRSEFVRAICGEDRIRCLLKTAEIHGHFCPGSALGVMATLYGLKHPGIGLEFSEGMEDLMAIVEINACFSDGVQAVSGCTLGNNALVYRDLGRHAVTFAMRGRNKGVRVSVRPDFRTKIDKAVPEFYPLMEKVVMNREGTAEEEALFKEKGREAAFAVLRLPFHELLKKEVVVPDLPEYAPVTKSAICPVCGESIMFTKTLMEGPNKGFCRQCGASIFHQVDGSGIVEKQGNARVRTN